MVFVLGGSESGVGSSRNISLKYIQIAIDKIEAKSCFMFSSFSS